MFLLMQKRLMIMLSMHVQKQARDRTESSCRDSFVVDAAGAACLCDFLRNDKKPLFIRSNIESRQRFSLRFVIHGEDELHEGALFSLSDHIF